MNVQIYLHDSLSHAYVGDRLAFWGFGGSGTDLAKAKIVTKDNACDHRNTEAPPSPKHTLMLEHALEQHPDAAEFHIQSSRAGKEIT